MTVQTAVAGAAQSKVGSGGASEGDGEDKGESAGGEAGASESRPGCSCNTQGVPPRTQAGGA